MARRRPKPDELNEAEQETLGRVLDAIRLRRTRGASLSRAARMAGTTIETVEKYAGSVVYKDGSRWEVKSWDRIPRRLHFLTAKGSRELEIRDSRTASKVSQHLNAFQAFASGRAGPEVLKPFKNDGATVDGEFHPFVTNPDVLMALAVSMPEFEDIYAFVR